MRTKGRGKRNMYMSSENSVVHPAMKKERRREMKANAITTRDEEEDDPIESFDDEKNVNVPVAAPDPPCMAKYRELRAKETAAVLAMMACRREADEYLQNVIVHRQSRSR